MEEKKCTKCGKVKPMTRDYFYVRKEVKCGFAGECKKCVAKRSRELRKNNSDVASRRRRAERQSKRRVNRAQMRFTNFEYRIKSTYGLSIDELCSMLDSQKGLCAICGESLVVPESKRSYHIDHCHSTLKVRGLLCNGCNLLLGHAKDSIKTLESAVRYLTID